MTELEAARRAGHALQAWLCGDSVPEYLREAARECTVRVFAMQLTELSGAAERTRSDPPHWTCAKLARHIATRRRHAAHAPARVC